MTRHDIRYFKGATDIIAAAFSSDAAFDANALSMFADYVTKHDAAHGPIVEQEYTVRFTNGSTLRLEVHRD